MVWPLSSMYTLQNKSASCGKGTQGLRGMAKRSKDSADQFSLEETRQRFEAALRGARITGHKPMSEMRNNQRVKFAGSSVHRLCAAIGVTGAAPWRDKIGLQTPRRRPALLEVSGVRS